MRRAPSVILPLALALALPPTAIGGQQPSDAPEADPSYLFVLGADSGSVEGDRLSLVGVPAVVWFSDRPERLAGHLSVADFLEAWGAVEPSFAEDPPNAALALLEASGEPVIIELTDAAADGEAVTFGVEVIDGNLPEGAFGVATLFVDSAHGLQQHKDNPTQIPLDQPGG
jgi:hypothetical protein